MINENGGYTNNQIPRGSINKYIDLKPKSRSEFFEAERETDKKYEIYNSAIENKTSGQSRNLEMMRKNPMNAINNGFRLSDGEKEILHKIAEINGVSRQTTEFFYRLSLVTGGVNNVVEFADNITGTEPGYYNKGMFTVGLTEADRDSLFSVKV
jgi:hypothetical protein